MDAQQLESLQKYLDLRSQEHAAGHQALMDVGKSTATLLSAQLKATQDRQLLSDLAEKVRTADGTCPNATRLWIKNIDRAATYTTDMLIVTKLVRKTVQGSLEFAIESFITEKTIANIELSRDDIPWSLIKPYVQQTFLPHNETELLIKKLAMVQQGTNEDLYQYKLRFLEAAEDAYPSSSRTPDNVKKCIKYFLKGLSSTNVTSAVLRGDPQTLEHAIQLAEREYRFDMSLQEVTSQRLEVPMDVSAITHGKQKSSIDKQLEHIVSKIAKLEARQDQSPHLPARQYRRQKNRNHKPSSWTPDGRPVCYNCGIAGHLSKDCRAPRRNTKSHVNQVNRQLHPSQISESSKPEAMECSAVNYAQAPALNPESNPFVPQYQNQGNW